MDEETKAKLRRCNRNIENGGMAMIVYGLWSDVKFLLPVVFGSMSLSDVLGPEIMQDPESKWIVLAITFLIMIVVFMSHYFLGRAAIRYARGKAKTKIFIIFAILFFILNLWGFSTYWEDIVEMESIWDADTLIASMLVDLTLLFILFDTIVSTFRVSRIRKKEGAVYDNLSEA